MSVRRQYIGSDPPTKPFHNCQQQLMGYPSFVWQQQLEKATIITYNIIHLYQKPIPVWDPGHTTTFTTRFRPITLMDELWGIGHWRPHWHWALSSALPELDLWKIRFLSPQSVIWEDPPSKFQIMVANGQLETPKSTIELKFEVGDKEFHEILIVMENLTGPIIGLIFFQRN